MRALALLFVGLLACGAPTTAPTVDGAPVPPRWRAVRESRGHVVHLDKKVPCNECHKPGEWKEPEPEACYSCHDHARVTLHADVAKTSTASPVCGDCHSFGEERHAPWDCARCHTMSPELAKAVGVHTKEECSHCHLPHSAKKFTVRKCGSCHEKQQNALHGPLKDPEPCRECHGGHGAAADANHVCSECHANQAPLVKRRFSPSEPGEPAPLISKQRSIPGHQLCVDCHRPHDVEERGFRACVHCHKDQPLDHGKGPTQCVDCHHPHDGPVAGTPPIMPRCATCHPDQNTHGKELTCLNCHKRHEVVISTKPALCVRCHQEDKPKGHQDCLLCHQEPGHQPKAVDGDCARCHDKVANHVTPGHKKCLDCHQVHGDLKIKGCADCHEKQAVSHHVLLLREAKGPGEGVKGVCGECHPAHDALRMPSCESCHPAAEREGLHGATAHQQCQSCHQGHQNPPFDLRAPCLTCHQAQQEHEPKADRCAVCHPFKE